MNNITSLKAVTTTAANLQRWQRLALQNNNKTAALFGRYSGYCGHYYQPPKSTYYRFLSSAAQPDDDNETLTVFKSWKEPKIECHGDYRNETFLEKYIDGQLYENQNDLPKLPVPTLEDTITRFLPTALPLVKSQQEEVELLEASEKFQQQAAKLQERLLERKDSEMKDTSWLQLWWNQLGYLQFRDTVVINVSYFLHFKDDPTITNIANEANIQRAAALLFSTGEFRKQTCSGNLPAEKVGKKQVPLCSTPYKYMFNACRIPRLEQDSYAIYDPSLHTHAIVARKGYFFAIEFVNKQTGNPLPIDVIENQLKQCIELADQKEEESSTTSTSINKLGILTTNNRDDWASARDELLKLGGDEMSSALDKLQSGAVVINLDDVEPISKTECGELFLTGGLNSGDNRWFDKSIQLVVTNNGKSAAVCEHSMMDGMPCVNYAGYITNFNYKQVKDRSRELESDEGTPQNIPKVVDIFGDVLEKIDTEKVNQLENEARTAFDGLISNQSNITQSFQGYGSNFIKKAGHSPDAFVQVAMQLATYRLFGEQAGTYEATQVRPFLHGRTETTRTVSSQSAAFVDKMSLKPKMDEHIDEERKAKLALLQEATEAHTQYTRIAAGAQGVDRHFFGLSMLADEGEELPDLFNSPVFARSKTWRVSTSHLTHPNFVNWGFGQVVPDGVGIAYSIHPNSCVFNITALRETGWTVQLSDLLEEALLEMKTLIEADTPPASKL